MLVGIAFKILNRNLYDLVQSGRHNRRRNLSTQVWRDRLCLIVPEEGVENIPCKNRVPKKFKVWNPSHIVLLKADRKQ